MILPSPFFNGKKILVCGMAKSGQAAVRLLHHLGAVVTAQDLKEYEKIDWAFPPEADGIHGYLGKNPDDIIDTFELLVISPGIPCDLPFVKKAEALQIPVWSEIELAYRCCPCPIIAITGTNGKTTTTTLVGEILKKAGHPTVVAGNIGIPFTAQIPALTPAHIVSAEISSFQLETVHTFKPWISAVLNITPDHLNRHKTMENYQATKEKIFARQTAEDFTILNYDDPCCRKMQPSAQTVYFSVKEDLSAIGGVYLDGDVIRARLFGQDETLADVRQIKILPANAAAAAAIALCAKIPPSVITETFVHFQGVPHRVEFVTEIDGVSFYNDSKATNTDSAIKGLEAMRQPVILIGGGYDKQSAFGDWIANFPNKVKHFIVMGETAETIISTCRAYGFELYERVNTLRDAVTLAFAKAQPGDCVLLSPACASWDMFDNFEQRGTLFKQFVYELRDTNG